jgi:small subunit ribosomal protein S15
MQGSCTFLGSAVPFTALAPSRRAAAVSVVTTAKAQRSRPALADVASFQAHATDTGSAEVQTALITRRIENLTVHLKEHDTDYACQRGLRMLLGQRTRLLRYVYDLDKERYFTLVTGLGIRKKKSMQ